MAKKHDSKTHRQKLAARADRHVLYQKAVQDPAAELDFVCKTYRRLRGQALRRLREDFCGTAHTACAFVRRHKDNIACGVDIDPEVLAWGREHNVAALNPAQRARLTLIEADVRTAGTEPVQAVLAMNFSYYLFHERQILIEYFRNVRRNLAADGVFFLDAYGGYESHMNITEKRKCDGFTYVWEQAEFNPIDHRLQCYIHFRFKDGSRLERAFSYDWRLWTLPELTEILRAAGFTEVTVYWEGTDEESGEGDGIFTPATRGDADAGWVCYLTASN